MWYSNLYRRHLSDMHIEDTDGLYLSEFSPEAYVENLKRCKANYAMIYYQSHVGLCNFPTKVGIMHKHFETNPETSFLPLLVILATPTTASAPTIKTDDKDPLFFSLFPNNIRKNTPFLFFYSFSVYLKNIYAY